MNTTINLIRAKGLSYILIWLLVKIWQDLKVLVKIVLPILIIVRGWEIFSPGDNIFRWLLNGLDVRVWFIATYKIAIISRILFHVYEGVIKNKIVED